MEEQEEREDDGSPRAMTDKQRKALEEMVAEYYSPLDPCRKFYLEAQIPSLDPNSTVLYAPGRDVAYLGDYLIEAMTLLLAGEYPFRREMIDAGATENDINHMIVRVTALVHAKGLQAKGWSEAYEAVSAEFPTGKAAELGVLALLGKLFLSAVWQGKRTANKASADGRSFFAVTDMGELVSSAARRFLSDEFAPVLDGLDEARKAFYKEVSDKMTERAKRDAEQKKELGEHVSGA
jgi:hypothetical protein